MMVCQHNARSRRSYSAQLRAVYAGTITAYSGRVLRQINNVLVCIGAAYTRRT